GRMRRAIRVSEFRCDRLGILKAAPLTVASAVPTRQRCASRPLRESCERRGTERTLRWRLLLAAYRAAIRRLRTAGWDRPFRGFEVRSSRDVFGLILARYLRTSGRPTR